jgi:hypothetical protein
MPHKRSKDGKYKQRYRQELYSSEQEKRFFKRHKERDVANAIVKEHCTRDPVTGEISYDESLKPSISLILCAAEYRFEVEDNIQPPRAVREQKGCTTHYEWNKINLKVIDDVLKREEAELLNRATSPCWWR